MKVYIVTAILKYLNHPYILIIGCSVTGVCTYFTAPFCDMTHVYTIVEFG